MAFKIPQAGKEPTNTQVMQKFNRMLKQETSPGDFERMREVIDNIFNKKTMSYEIKYGEPTLALFSCDRFKTANNNLNLAKNTNEERITINGVDMYTSFVKDFLREYVEKWLDFAAFLDKILHARGYRGRDILTPQEHALIGSTWDASVKITMENAHIPVGVLEKNMIVEEARLARELSAILNNVNMSGYFSDQHGTGCFALETLGDDGKTVRDPRLVDFGAMDRLARKRMPLAEAIEKSVIKAMKKEGFPYSRD